MHHPKFGNKFDHLSIYVNHPFEGMSFELLPKSKNNAKIIEKEGAIITNLGSGRADLEKFFQPTHLGDLKIYSPAINPPMF